MSSNTDKLTKAETDVLSISPYQYDRLDREIRAGVTPYVAAGIIGIPPQKYYAWIKRGKEGEPPFSEFYAFINSCLAKSRAKAERSVHALSPLAWLERGPGGRPSEEDPASGWRAESVMKHVGPDGKSAPTFHLEFTVMGPRAIVTQPPALNSSVVDTTIIEEAPHELLPQEAPTVSNKFKGEPSKEASAGPVPGPASLEARLQELRAKGQ